jgi:hypothetical protein
MMKSFWSFLMIVVALYGAFWFGMIIGINRHVPNGPGACRVGEVYVCRESNTFTKSAK